MKKERRSVVEMFCINDPKFALGSSYVNNKMSLSESNSGSNTLSHTCSGSDLVVFTKDYQFTKRGNPL